VISSFLVSDPAAAEADALAAAFSLAALASLGFFFGGMLSWGDEERRERELR